MNKAITQHYFSGQAQRVQPVVQADKPRDQRKQQSFAAILKKQINEDHPTFVMTRLAGVLLVTNIVNQVGIWRGWW